jgi:hypothetical protein
MRPVAAWILVVAAIIPATPAIAAEDARGREFEATAIMDNGSGTRRMTATLVARRFTPREEAQRLREVLEEGGQWALLQALRGRSDGRLRLGALELPISLVVATPADDGFRYLFLTARRIRFEERNEGRESLDYPFGVAVFEVGDFGTGEGTIHTAASLAVDQDGTISVEQYESDPGRLVRVKKVR